MAEKFWIEIPNHFPFVELGEFVIMPNHVHGIIIIDKNVETPNLGVCTNVEMCNTESDVSTKSIVETPKLGVSTNVKVCNTESGVQTDDIIKWKSGTLGVIINQYKRICTIKSRLINPDFAWQPLFHDHIIRNGKTFEKIQNYIISNPLNWKADKFYN